MSSLPDHMIVATASPNDIPLKREDVQQMDVVLLSEHTPLECQVVLVLKETTFVMRQPLVHLTLPLVWPVTNSVV